MKRSHSNLRKNNRGVTLVETVAAIVVLGIALPPLLALFTNVAQRTPDDLYQRAALLYADGLMEEILSKSFEDPQESPGSFGREEGVRASFDDVDDFHGLNNSPPVHIDGSRLDDYGGFTRRAVVENILPTAPNALAAQLPGSTDAKRVRVTVSWTGARGGAITLTTLRTNLAAASDPSPLDELASAASAFNRDRDELQVQLISDSGSDLEVQSFELTSSRDIPELREFDLATRPNDFERIWRGREDLPTGLLDVNDGDSNERVVPAGGFAEARFDFQGRVSPGPITFTLDLTFTDGSSSSLEISFSWLS